jgi:IMP dehydrogenase/GMP reductase
LGGEHGNALESDEEEEEEEGEVVESKDMVATETVEVTVELPKGLKKKQKKGFDIEAYVKREIGKVRRATQVRQYSSNYVCMCVLYITRNIY